jgi:hypothetical protein
MQPRRLFSPLRAECWFQVTKRGYSPCTRAFPEDDFELSDVLEEAGVVLPFELEPEPGVEGKELSLIAGDPVLLFRSLEIAAGFTDSSVAVLPSDKGSSCSREAPASVEW